MNNNFPVDIVITWVDTSDKKWQNRYENTLNKPFMRTERGSPEYSRPDTELCLCLELIRKNIPWIRKIFIVTQQQDPTCRKENEILIDHSMLGLGLVFNSLAIETSLYKIPGLSEHFLYLNDDFYVVKKIRRDMFFTEEGKTIIYLDHNYGNSIYMRTNRHTLKEYNSDDINLCPAHVPYALTITQMKSAENLFPELWENGRNAKERGANGEIQPILATYINSLKNETAIRDNGSNLKYTYAPTPYSMSLFSHWFNINSPHIVCINSFNTSGKDLYNSIRKTPVLYKTLTLRYIILMLITFTILIIYRENFNFSKVSRNIIILIIIIYMCLYLLSRLRPAKNSSVDCIISACGKQADVEYTKSIVRKYYGPQTRFFVYNKCGDIPDSIKLPNVGREQHTYALHVVQNYHDLSDRLIFTPDRMLGHRPRREKILRDASTLASDSGFYCGEHVSAETFGSISGWVQSKYQGRYLDPAEPRGVANWARTHIGYYGAPAERSCREGTFVTTRELVRETPREIFKAVMRQLSVNEPEATHYMERILPLIYGDVEKVP